MPDQRGDHEARGTARARATRRRRRAVEARSSSRARRRATPSSTTSSSARRMNGCPRGRRARARRAHQSVVVVVGRQHRRDASAAGQPTIARRRCASSTSRGERLAPGGPNAIWRRLRHSTRVPARRLVDVVGGDEHAAALAGERRRAAPSSRSALGASRPREGLVEQQHAGRPARSARAISTRWRWPPESSPNVASAAVGEADRASAASARRARRARAAATTGSARQRAHQRDVERADREVQPRALGLRRRWRTRGPHARAVPRSGAQLAEQRAEQRRLAAAVGAEHARRRGAGRDREAHVLEHRRRRRSRPRARRPRSGAVTGPRSRIRRRRPVKPAHHRVGVGALHLQVGVAARAARPERVAVERRSARAPVWRATARASFGLIELSGNTALTRSRRIMRGELARARRPTAGPGSLCGGITAPTTSIP